MTTEPNAQNVPVPGLASIYVADHGVSLPAKGDITTDPTTLGFDNVGHTDEKAGIGWNFKLDRYQRKSHQSLENIIDKVTGRDVSWDVPLLEANASTAALMAYGGGTIVRTGGVGCFTPAPVGKRRDLSVVIDLEDGDIVTRWVVPLAAIGGDVKTKFAPAADPTLPVNIAPIGGTGVDAFYWSSNAPGLVTSARSAVQQLVLAATAGTIALAFNGSESTSALTATTLTASALQTALRALSTIGASGVNVTGSTGGPFTITFAGPLANTAVPVITVDTTSLTGTATITSQVQGRP